MKQKIEDVEIVFGSDTKKAIHYISPKATHLLCTKHLKDNVRQNLRDKIECFRQENDENVLTPFLNEDELLDTVMTP